MQFLRVRSRNVSSVHKASECSKSKFQSQIENPPENPGLLDKAALSSVTGAASLASSSLEKYLKVKPLFFLISEDLLNTKRSEQLLVSAAELCYK